MNNQNINYIADSYLEYMDINSYHLVASRNNRTWELNKGRISKNDTEIEWGIVEVSKMVEPYLISTEMEEASLANEELEISPTLIYSLAQGNNLFFEEIDLYGHLPWNEMRGNIYRPVVPLTPRMVALLCSMVVNDAELVNDVWVTNFPVKNGEPDWGKFKEIEQQITSVYPNPCYDLKKVRQPEAVHIGIREATVATFSEQLKKTRNETFEYFRNIEDFSLTLMHIQRFNQNNKFSPRMVVLLDMLLGDYHYCALTNMVDNTCLVYSLNYPYELYVNSVRDMSKHLKELVDNAVKKLRTKTDDGFEYDYENLPELFSVINLVLEFLHEIVEIPQYSFHATPKHIEF